MDIEVVLLMFKEQKPLAAAVADRRSLANRPLIANNRRLSRREYQ
jgi:hypothetical protein